MLVGMGGVVRDIEKSCFYVLVRTRSNGFNFSTFAGMGLSRVQVLVKQ